MFGFPRYYCIRPKADPQMALQVDPSSRKEDLLDAALGERIYAASKPKMTLGMGKRGKASKPLQVSAVQTPQNAQPLTP